MLRKRHCLSRGLQGLKDDECIVVVDYKMKILAAFYRENQALFFGKRGTSLLGWMIIVNRPGCPGEKDVQFVFMVSNDTGQTDLQVLAAKAYIYTELLPELYPQVKKVRLRADGAGCFNSKLQRGCQLLWGRVWGNIFEESVRISIAGDGKSNLDGMFGMAGFKMKVLAHSCLQMPVLAEQ